MLGSWSPAFAGPVSDAGPAPLSALRARDQPRPEPDVSVRHLDPEPLGDLAAAAGAQDRADRGQRGQPGVCRGRGEAAPAGSLDRDDPLSLHRRRQLPHARPEAGGDRAGAGRHRRD